MEPASSLFYVKNGSAATTSFKIRFKILVFVCESMFMFNF